MVTKEYCKEICEDFEYIENGEASDIIVRGKEDVFVMLCTENASKATKRRIGMGSSLAKSIGAKLLVVAKRIGNEDMLDEVVYERYNAAVVTPETARQLLEGDEVYIRKLRSMFVVEIDGQLLRKRRLESGLSIGAVAEAIGVSRKSVYEYERGHTRVHVDVAIKLAELFGEDILRSVNLDKLRGEELKVPPHTPMEAKILSTTSSVHVAKGKVSVGGFYGNEEFTAVVPHGGKEDLRWFAALSKLIKRKAVAIGFKDVPKELEESPVEVVDNLQEFFKVLKEEREVER